MPGLVPVQIGLWSCGLILPDGRPEDLDLLAHDPRASRLRGILHPVSGDVPPGHSTDLVNPYPFVDDPVVLHVDIVVDGRIVDDGPVALIGKDVTIDVPVLKVRTLDEDPEIEGDVERLRIEVDSHSESDAGWKRRPAHVLIVRPPGHPSGAPVHARDPKPADVVVHAPAAIVEGNIPPFLVRDPGPAIIGPDPMSFAIGPPVVAHMPGDPNVAVGVIVDPAPVRGKTIIKVGHIFILTVPLRPAGILLITWVHGASRAGRIADSGRRTVSGATRRNHKNQRE